MNTYIVATDGASNSNHFKTPCRTVGWGFHALRSDGRIAERSGICKGQGESNQSAELQAVIQALSFLQPNSVVTIETDSQYVLSGATQWMSNWKAKGWKNAQGKPVLHKDRWLALDELLKTRIVTFVKVKGHSGHPRNERADVLATSAQGRIT